MLKTFTIPDGYADEQGFTLFFLDADRAFLSTNDKMAVVRISDSKVVAEKELAYAKYPVPLAGNRLFLMQDFKKQALILDASTLKTVAKLGAHKKVVTGNGEVDPSGRYAATGAEGGELLLHDLETGQSKSYVVPKPKGLKSHPGIDSVHFSHDGKHLVVEATELAGPVRVLSVPDLNEVFVAKDVKDRDNDSFECYLSNDRKELLLHYNTYDAENEEAPFADEWSLVSLGSKSSTPWKGAWKEFLGSGFAVSQNGHLSRRGVAADQAAPRDAQVIHVGKPVDEAVEWGPFWGVRVGRTVEYWVAAEPAPPPFETAKPGEVFLEVFISRGQDVEAATKIVGASVRWKDGNFPYYGEGKKADLQLERSAAAKMKARLSEAGIHSDVRG